MSDIEKRKFTRYPSMNLLNIVLHEEGREIGQGIGKTLNISETGMLLETTFEIVPDQTISVTIAIGEDLFDLDASVMRCEQAGEDRYHVGVTFLEMDKSRKAALTEYIVAFEKFSAE